MSGDVHVRHSGSLWTVSEEGGAAIDAYPSRNAAMAAGRRLASRNGSQHLLHGRDGRVLQRDSYGAVPRPPR